MPKMEMNSLQQRQFPRQSPREKAKPPVSARFRMANELHYFRIADDSSHNLPRQVRTLFLGVSLLHSYIVSGGGRNESSKAHLISNPVICVWRRFYIDSERIREI